MIPALNELDVTWSNEPLAALPKGGEDEYCEVCAEMDRDDDKTADACTGARYAVVQLRPYEGHDLAMVTHMCDYWLNHELFVNEVDLDGTRYPRVAVILLQVRQRFPLSNRHQMF